MAMFCMNQSCQWCMHCSALAAIWTGMNLTSCWTMSKFMEWWYALRAATGQSLHIVLIDSTRVHKLGDGRLKLGPGCVMKNRCWGLNDTPTKMLQLMHLKILKNKTKKKLTHLKIHLDIFQFILYLGTATCCWHITWKCSWSSGRSY